MEKNKKYNFIARIYGNGLDKEVTDTRCFCEWEDHDKAMDGVTEPTVISIIPDKCLTKDIWEETTSKLLKDEFNRDKLDVIRCENVFWIESRGASDRAYRIAIRETKRIFPCLKYLYDCGMKEA